MEDTRSYPFAPLSTDTINEDQFKAIDDLIDDLLIPETSEKTDEKEKYVTFEPKETVNPYYQHLYTCLTHRALHPGTHDLG